MQDFRFLIKRGGNTWNVTKRVPRHLRSILGKSHLRKSTKTTDPVEARKRRWPVLARMQTVIDEAQKQHSAGSVMGEAMAWREHLSRIRAGDLSHVWDSRYAPGSDDLRRASLAQSLDFVEEDAAAIAAKHGPAVAEAFTGIATGTATPLLHGLEDALREGGTKGMLNLRTQAQQRSAVLRFAAWCERNHIPATVEAVGKVVAGKYATAAVAANMDAATWNKHCLFLSSYWRWLIKRTDVAVNPWQGQRRSKAGRKGKIPPRPFTDAEMLALLQGKKDQELDDVIRFGALTGARLEDLYELTVRDCQGGIFNILDSKTPAGTRPVPIHSDLAARVAARCAGKGPEAFLFHEAGGAKPDRSAPMSKRFGRYRERCGVHERPEGQRQSCVNYHSFRRWFITQSRNAGIDLATVNATVGHKNGSLADDTYSSGPTMEMRRHAVEAVRLPG